MVLSNLIVSLMKSFLSPYIENFNADQLNVFGWSGQIKLSELYIKPNAIDTLKLPFRITQGYIGQIDISVPWMNIYSEPIVIKVSDIYAVVIPNYEVDYNEEEELDYEWQIKKAYLDNIESVKKKLEEDSKNLPPQDDGFFMKLITAAIKNVQIFISKVHICYEDATTGDRPFQMGLAFSRLIFETESGGSSGGGGKNHTTAASLINKIIRLEGFCYYLNHENIKRYYGKDKQEVLKKLREFFSNPKDANYILCPIQFYTYAVIDRKPESSNYENSVFDLDMHLGEFQIKFDDKQVRALLHLLDSIDRLTTASMYRKWRPNVPIKENPKLWWKFLFSAISETGIRRRKKEFSWKNIAEACAKRRLYIKLYKEKLMGHYVDPQELENLERQLNLFVIVMARTEAEIATKKAKLDKQEKSKKVGWLGSWWTSSSSDNKKITDSEDDDLIENIKKEFTEGQEKEKLYQAIGYDENSLGLIYPADYVAYKIRFHMNNLQIQLLAEQQKICLIGLKNLTFNFKSRPRSGNIEIDNEFDSVQITGIKNISLMKSKTDKKFLVFKLVMNPLDKKCDYSLHLEMKSLRFLLDIYTVNQLAKLFAPPENICLEEIKAAAQYKLDDIRMVTYSQVQNAIEKHKQLDLRIKVHPSFVIIPKKADFNKSNTLLLVSLGEFKMDSKLVPKNNIDKLTNLTNKKEIIKLIYETYSIQVKNVQVVLSNHKDYETDMEQLNTERHILFPFELTVNFHRSIISSDPRFPKLDMDGNIPSIELKASDAQVSMILLLLATLPYGPTIYDELEMDQIDNELKQQQQQQQIKAVEMPKIKPTAVAAHEEVKDAMKYAAQAAKVINRLNQEKTTEELDSKNLPTTETKTIIVHKDLIFSFKLNEIIATLYRNDRKEESKFSRIQLVKFSIYGEMFNDKTLLIDCGIQDLLAIDLRQHRNKNGILTMLSKSRHNDVADEKSEKNILSLYMAHKKEEMVVMLTMSKFNLILSVDYILALIDVATKASIIDLDSVDKASLQTSKSKTLAKSSVSAIQKLDSKLKDQKSVNTKIMVEFLLRKMEIFMLESLDNVYCEALVFNCSSKFNIKIEDDVKLVVGTIQKMNVSLINYGDYISNGHLEAYIMAPTDLNINGTMKGQTLMLDLTFNDIYIKISPSMLQIIFKIMASIIEKPEEKMTREKRSFENLDKLLQPKPIDKKLWFLHYAPTAKEALTLLQSLESEEQKSNIIVNLNKIVVLIQSGGLQSQPLVKIDLSAFAKLVDNKNLDLECSILSDYYNHLISAWEPLIEPVDNKIFTFHGKVDLSDTVKVEVQTTENLEILLTRTSVNVLYSISEAFTKVIKAKQTCIDEFNRVVVKNYLGYKIILFMEESNLKTIMNSNDQKKASSSSIIVESGQEYKFESFDNNNVKLRVNIIFSENVVIERTIICKKSSIRCYFTSIKSYPVAENWKFIIQVHNVGATKEVVFRSNTEIKNNFDNKFELYQFLNEQFSHVGTIQPHSTFYLPMPIVYGESLLYVKPSDDYELCVPPFSWRETKERPARIVGNPNCCLNDSMENRPYLLLSCIDKENEKKRFQIKVRGEKCFILYEDTDKQDNPDSFLFTIKMIPLARLCNLLPYSIVFKYNPMNEIRTLEPGEDFNLPFIDFGHSIIQYKLEYLKKEFTCKELIPEFGKGQLTTSYYKFTTNNGIDEMIIPVEFRVDNSTLNLSLYSHCWIMNRTMENIRIAVEDNRPQIFKANIQTPQLFSYELKGSKKPKMCVGISKTDFSQYFPIDVAPFQIALLPKIPGQRFYYPISVRVEASKIPFTKIINVEPFYSIINLTVQKVQFSENNEDWFEVDSNELQPFYPRKASNQSICFRLSKNGLDSKHISLCESSQTLLAVDKNFLFINVDVNELEAKIRIIDYFDGAAPALLVNKLKYPIYYGQQDVSNWKTLKHIRKLEPGHMVYFCWFDPYKTKKMVYKINLEAEEICVNINFDTFLKFGDDYAWVSFLDGKQRILLFTTDMTLPENLLMTNEFIKPDMSVELIVKGLGLNIVDNEKKLDLFYLSIKSNTIWECRSESSRTFKAVSIKENEILENMYQHSLLIQSNSRASIIKSDRCNYEANFQNMTLLKPKLAYLRRISNRGLWVTFSRSEHIQNIHVRINEIQLDNQLSGSIFEVVFSPVVVPKSVSEKYEIERKNFIELCAIICPGTVTRYKDIQLLIQEFMIQIELGWIFKLMHVFDIKTEADESNKELIQSDLDYILKFNSPDELQKYSMNKSYYDSLMLGPIKLHLGMNFGEGLTEGNLFFLLELIMRLGGTVGEISDALFKLDYFERKYIFIGKEELTEQLTNHYKNQFLKQFYKIILGLDIIGNPMKLAMGITKGVGDFFYEPAAGIIHGPEEFAEGLALGVKSLAVNVLGGTAGALGRIGTTLGTGVATLTVDDKFQRERRERINKKTSFAENSKNLFKGIFSGVTGVLTKPIQGAKEEGVEGMFKGVGKGVVGLFAQPATSVIDFASGSLQAFNNAIDPKKVANKVREPRAFNQLEIKPYSRHEAKGYQIFISLNHSKLSRDEYVDHIQVTNNVMILLTNKHLVCLKQAFISNQWEVDWLETWRNCQEIFVDGYTIHIKLKVAKKNFILESSKERIIAFDIKNEQCKEQAKHIIQNLHQKMNKIMQNYRGGSCSRSTTHSRGGGSSSRNRPNDNSISANNSKTTAESSSSFSSAE